MGRVPDVVLALATRGARLTKVAPHERSLEELYFAVRRPHIATGDAPEGGGLAPVAPPPDALAATPVPAAQPAEEASV